MVETDRIECTQRDLDISLRLQRLEIMVTLPSAVTIGSEVFSWLGSI